MARTLYFHIGLHKTGSTSLQRALSLTKDPRIFNVPPPHRKTREKSWYSNDWLDLHTTRPKEARMDFHQNLAPALADHNSGGDVIFSAEDSAWILQLEYLQKFAKELARYFDAVKIIVYLRRQDASAISLVQEATRSDNTFNFAYIGKVMGALPDFSPHIDLIFDYNQRMQLWAEAFGAQALIFQVYEDAVAGEGILESFACITGLHFSKTDIQLRRSPSKMQQYLNQTLRDMNLDFIGSRAMGLKGEKMLPTRRDAENFYQRYRPHNLALNARFKITKRETIFDEDFSIYSVADNEHLEHVEADKIIRALLGKLCESEMAYLEAEKLLQSLQNEIEELRAKKREY